MTFEQKAEELAALMRMRDMHRRAAGDPRETRDMRSLHARKADDFDAEIKAAPRDVYEAAMVIYAGPVTETDD